MKKVGIEKLKPTVLDDKSSRWELTEPLETTSLSLNRYRLEPGVGLPSGIHAHMDQEEVFIVLEGTATFETMDGPVTVDQGEAIRFAPGEFQSGKNEGDNDLVLLALGAPRNTEDVRIPVDCPDCHHQSLRLEYADGDLSFVCPGCEAEHIPRSCPECGHADLRVTLDDTSRTVVVCQTCDSVFDSPPLRDKE
jgi:uncharacterized cupin superfamily protein